MGVLALRGWRLDRGWALLGAGFLVLCVADSIYLLQSPAALRLEPRANLFYMTGVGLLALAAWQPRAQGSARALQGWSMLLVPGAFVSPRSACSLYDHF